MGARYGQIRSSNASANFSCAERGSAGPSATRGANTAVAKAESYQGKRIERTLYRAELPDGLVNWPSARQLWRVKQVTYDRTGSRCLAVEDRYFVTSLSASKLTPAQILEAVRLHWSIENDLHWTLDVISGEDSGAWCQSNLAVQALSWIRLIAYNLMAWLKRRHLRSKNTRGMPWRELGEEIRTALRIVRVSLQQTRAEVDSQTL